MTWEGSGPKLNIEPFADTAASLRDALKNFEMSDAKADADMFEGQASPAIHEMLTGLPLAIIDDPGFWRYLSLAHFWWLAQWRHPSAFESNDPALYLRYVDGVLTTECVLSRMYLRAQIAEIDGDYSLTTAVAQGSDFWRSHILRVSTGASPPLSRRCCVNNPNEECRPIKPGPLVETSTGSRAMSCSQFTMRKTQQRSSPSCENRDKARDCGRNPPIGNDCRR